MSIIAFVICQTYHDGRLIAFCVGFGFVIAVNLQGRLSFAPGVPFFYSICCVGTTSYILDFDPFEFKIIFIFWETLNATLMCGQFNFFLAIGACSLSTLVIGARSSTSWSWVQFVDVPAVGALTGNSGVQE